MSIYSDLRERALKTPNSQFIKVPTSPSLGMVLAAAHATDVFRPGDTLWEYFSPFEDEYGDSGDNIYVDVSLVEKYGLQKAYCLSVIADTWSNCLLGLESWQTSRARNSNVSKNGEDLVYYLPDTCPADGYPMQKSDCTDAHRQHARCSTEPFKGYYADWYSLDRETMFVAPRKLPYHAANVAARADLSVASFLEFADVLDSAKVPYVPNFSYDGPFTEDERGELLVAVIWRAGISWLLSEDQPDAIAFPRHPFSQAAIISNEMFRRYDLWNKVDKFIGNHPYRQIDIHAATARLTMGSNEGRSFYRYEDYGTGRVIQAEGLILSNGYDQSGLRELLLRLSMMPIKRIDAMPLNCSDPV